MWKPPLTADCRLEGGLERGYIARATEPEVDRLSRLVYGHHLDQIAEAELVVQVPAHASDDHTAVKMPSSK